MTDDLNYFLDDLLKHYEVESVDAISYVMAKWYLKGNQQTKFLLLVNSLGQNCIEISELGVLLVFGEKNHNSLQRIQAIPDG